MGNGLCKACNSQNTKDEVRNDILYSDSTYNIWDNDPIRSLNSFQTQLSFSTNLNGQVNGFQKNQYSSITSPKNGSQNIAQNNSMTQSQINLRLEIMSELIKKQPSIIHEETEVDTIVDLPKESMRHLYDGQKVGPSNFSYQQPDEEYSSILQIEKHQENENEQGNNVLSKKSIHSHNSQIENTDRKYTEVNLEQVLNTPQQSLKHIQYDNNNNYNKEENRNQTSRSTIDQVHQNNSIQNKSSKIL